MKVLLTMMVILLSGMTAKSTEMTFDNRCMGNAAESCAIIASGIISKNTPIVFKQFMDTDFSDGEVVLLHSRGGNLAGGVALGKLIREYNLSTEVGGGPPVSQDEIWEWPDAGVCESACAYAFLGGRRRELGQSDKLGFHRFYSRSQNIDAASAQVLSGILVQYIIEMGVDARIFTLASKEADSSMFYASSAQTEKFSIITPYGFDHFIIEGYKNGIVAYSKRKGDVDLYDYTKQLTAFCKNGQPKLLYFMDVALDQTAKFTLYTDNAEHTVSEQNIVVRPGKETSFLEVALTKQQARAIANASAIETYFSYARVFGGSFPYQLELSPLDKKAVAAAFKFCIE